MKNRPKPKRKWTLKDVHEHLDYAVNLEMWTIPYYMTVMYSIKDPSEPAFRLIQSIVYQEMLHAELAANVYNSFQPARPLQLGPFHYTKEGGVPHLDFELDPAAVAKYGEPDARLGGLDYPRIGTMCLIELPESEPPPLNQDAEEYATIGDFYTALRYGMQQHAKAVRGNNAQVDYFKNFYGNLTQSTVTADGHDGLNQALELIEVITEQGEGRCKADQDIPLAYQNTADGYNSSWSHFLKFNAIRDGLLTGRVPDTYHADPAKRDTEPQQVLVRNFGELIKAIEARFSGSQVPDFGAVMPTVGASILTCWRRGVVPQFSLTQ